MLQIFDYFQASVSVHIHFFIISPMFIKHARLRGRIKTNTWRHLRIVEFAEILVSQPRLVECWMDFWWWTWTVLIESSLTPRDAVMTSSNQSPFINSFQDAWSFPSSVWSSLFMNISLYTHVSESTDTDWRLLLKCQTIYTLRLSWDNRNHFYMLDAR